MKDKIMIMITAAAVAAGSVYGNGDRGQSL